MANHTDEHGKSTPAQSKIAKKMRIVGRGRVRHGFDKVAKKHVAAGRHDQAAKVELAREYFTNKKFRKGLEAHTWKLNKRKA